MKKAKNKQKTTTEGTAKSTPSNTRCYTKEVATAEPRRLSVYKNKRFERFQKDARISDAELWDAATNAAAGEIDADLGGGVVKQRIAREGEGKSGGSRVIILFRKGSRAVFVYGFEKKDLANINEKQLAAFRKLATEVLGYTEAQIATNVDAGALIQVPASQEPKEKTSAKKVRR